ncbi:MAG: hypothetical protein ACI9ZT_002037 [Gammaproteobacteria bacterium]|jgi:hypothetical protein
MHYFMGPSEPLISTGVEQIRDQLKIEKEISGGG